MGIPWDPQIFEKYFSKGVYFQTQRPIMVNMNRALKPKPKQPSLEGKQNEHDHQTG